MPTTAHKPGFKFPAGKVPPSKWENRIVAVFTIGFLAYVAVAGYQWLDGAGWITHRATLPVIFESYNGEQWLAGEIRNCTTYRDGVQRMDCGLGDRQEEHVIPVLFHGRTDRTDHAYFTWRCQRESVGCLQPNAVTCWALD